MDADHPDAAWVRQTVEDLTAWLATSKPDVTSQITGGGAVRSAEEALSRLHGGRMAVLVPSATYGMRAALRALGVGRGSRVLIPALDWGSTLGAVLSLGAVPRVVDVDPATATLDPAALTRELAADADAAVVCHLHGVVTDVPGVRRALGADVPIVEDCAQADGSTLDGVPAGQLGDIAVFSYGPTKAIDVGEAAAVVAADHHIVDRVLELTAHPVRQRLAGIERPAMAELSVRVDRISAVRLALALERWDPRAERARHRGLAVEVAARTGAVRVLGADERRQNAARRVPLAAGAGPVGQPLVAGQSGALRIAELVNGRVVPTQITLVGVRGAQ